MLKDMWEKNRRVLHTGVVIGVVCCVLTACGGDSADQPGEESTPGTATFNPEITKEPRVFHAVTNEEDVAADPCNPAFQEWEKQNIGFFIQQNKGTWPSTEMTFTPTTVTGDLQACEITVTGANITDSDGGDLNNFTVITTARPDSLNPTNQEIINNIFLEDEDDVLAKANNLNDVDVEKLKKISPLVVSAIDYATDNNMDKASFWTIGYNYGLGAVFSNNEGNMCLATVLNGGAVEGVDPARIVSGWAVVKTQDQQKETERRTGGAAGQLTYLLGGQLNSNPPLNKYAYYITKD